MAWVAARLRMLARLRRDRRLVSARHAWAFLKVPRHRFAPPGRERASYGPVPLEITDGQTMTCPDFVAQMTGLLDVRPGDRVLEIGTGTGFQAALLGALGAQVWTLEVRPEIHRMAVENLSGHRRVEARLGDGSRGLAEVAPFDGIILGCAVDPVPDALLDQLAIGGRLVAPQGRPDRMQTLVRLRREETGMVREEVRAAWFVPMVDDQGRPVGA